MMRSPRSSSLPDWFTRPKAVPRNDQDSLFTGSIDEWLAKARISSDELGRWEEAGYVPSLDRASQRPFNDPVILRLELIRDVVRSGLPDREIAWLLSQLHSASIADPCSLAFSFRYGWVQPTWTSPSQTCWERSLQAWLDDAEPSDIKELSGHSPKS